MKLNPYLKIHSKVPYKWYIENDNYSSAIHVKFSMSDI